MFDFTKIVNGNQATVYETSIIIIEHSVTIRIRPYSIMLSIFPNYTTCISIFSKFKNYSHILLLFSLHNNFYFPI